MSQMSELAPEQETPEAREAQVEEQEQAMLDEGVLKLNPYNDAEVAHQRWLETGQTEPAALIPEQAEDQEDDEGEAEAPG
jgi:hypothetical protein